ncbi:MAG TPA: CinA family protein [Stellaceae bacterium]|nr:CinA family protein [Stellaceae bacterium]
MLQDLLPQAERIAAKLKARNETISIAESSTAGLLSAALLAIPGASAYFLGGAVVYTRQSRSELLAVTEQELTASPPRPSPTRCSLPARSAASWRRVGRLAKPAPPARPAAATAMPPGIPASP